MNWNTCGGGGGLFQFTPKTIPEAQPNNFTREPKFENVGLAYLVLPLRNFFAFNLHA